MTNTYHNFTINPVGKGIYAAIPNGGSNAGIVDLGDQTLVFDTFTTVGAAKELKMAAEHLTGRAPSLVINSHAHADHYQGNVAFSNHAVVIASTKTRQAIAEEGLLRLERMKNSMMEQANDLRKRLELSTDDQEKIQIQAVLREYDEFFEDYPEPEDLRVPVLTFEKSIIFHGTQRKAELITFGGAHSPCDAVLWLPDDEILFSADLIIPNDNLILTQGQPENWEPILDQLEALHPRTIVPGHGQIVSVDEGFQWARFYLRYMFRLVRELVASDAPILIEDLVIPSGCRRNGFVQNIRFLLDRAYTVTQAN
jgi:cyclase